jgi:Tol biopolymer transport system component
MSRRTTVLQGAQSVGLGDHSHIRLTDPEDSVNRRLVHLLVLLLLLGCSEGTPESSATPRGESRRGAIPRELAGVITVSQLTNQPGADLVSFDVRRGASVRPSITGRGNDLAPAWSPDGKRLAFAREDNSQSDIYYWSRGKVVRVTRTSGSESGPTWAPDGTDLVYSYTPANRSYLDRSYLSRRNLTHGTTRRIPLEFRVALDPAWSPDGTRIAFVGQRRRGGPFELFVVRPDGSSLKRLTRSGDPEWNPTWSPDSQRLLAERNTAGTGSNQLVLVSGVTASRPRLLFEVEEETTSLASPQWAPSGDWMAFVLAEEEETSLVALPSDGSGELVSLLRVDGTVGSISWALFGQ